MCLTVVGFCGLQLLVFGWVGCWVDLRFLLIYWVLISCGFDVIYSASDLVGFGFEGLF